MEAVLRAKILNYPTLAGACGLDSNTRKKLGVELGDMVIIYVDDLELSFEVKKTKSELVNKNYILFHTDVTELYPTVTDGKEVRVVSQKGMPITSSPSAPAHSETMSSTSSATPHQSTATPVQPSHLSIEKDDLMLLRKALILGVIDSSTFQALRISLREDGPFEKEVYSLLSGLLARTNTNAEY